MLPVLIHLWGVLEYIWDIRVLLLFLASFLQELALLHGWIEHALLPPDYMDLSGIYINSSAAARVCTILQTKNAARNSQRDTDLSKERRWEDGRHKEGEEGEVCYRVIDSLAQTKQTYQYCMSTSLLINFTWWPLSAEKGTCWHTYKFNYDTQMKAVSASTIKLLVNVPVFNVWICMYSYLIRI